MRKASLATVSCLGMLLAGSAAFAGELAHSGEINFVSGRLQLREILVIEKIFMRQIGPACIDEQERGFCFGQRLV